MKNIVSFIFCLAISVNSCLVVIAQNVSINETGAAPDGSAMLDVASTDRGMLIPRLTTTQRDAIATPATSLMIYNTTDQCLQVYMGTQWINIQCACDPPLAPVSSTATSITESSFDANWSASTGADTYSLWVDDNSDFSSPLAGYGPKTGIAGTSETVSSLSCGVTYYYRVQAVSGCGTGGNSTDITVATTSCPSCGAQEWATANINVGTRINGAPGGGRMTSPGGNEKYCVNDLEANCTTYGGLYEWAEAMNYAASASCDPCGAGGVQGICPSGYHVPTDLEWSRYEHCVETTIAPTGSTTLATFQTTGGFRGDNTASIGAGDKMKHDISWNGTNTAAFGALAGGLRLSSTGAFNNVGTYVYFWSATDNGTPAKGRIIGNTENNINRNDATKTHGYYLRCLKN